MMSFKNIVECEGPSDQFITMIVHQFCEIKNGFHIKEIKPVEMKGVNSNSFFQNPFVQHCYHVEFINNENANKLRKFFNFPQQKSNLVKIEEKWIAEIRKELHKVWLGNTNRKEKLSDSFAHRSSPIAILHGKEEVWQNTIPDAAHELHDRLSILCQLTINAFWLSVLPSVSKSKNNDPETLVNEQSVLSNAQVDISMLIECGQPPERMKNSLTALIQYVTKKMPDEKKVGLWASEVLNGSNGKSMGLAEHKSKVTIK